MLRIKGTNQNKKNGVDRMIKMGTNWQENKDQSSKTYKVVNSWLEDTPPAKHLNNTPAYTVLVLKDMEIGKTHSVAQNVVYKCYTQVS